jgi:hypothetical protein
LQKLTTISIIGGVVVLVGSIAGLIFIINKLDPDASVLNPILLYTSIFGIIGASAFLIGFYFRQIFGIREFAARHIGVSTRQGVFLGLLVAVSLALQAMELFNVWNALFLVLTLVFLESYFLFR